MELTEYEGANTNGTFLVHQLSISFSEILSSPAICWFCWKYLSLHTEGWRSEGHHNGFSYGLFFVVCQIVGWKIATDEYFNVANGLICR